MFKLRVGNSHDKHDLERHAFFKIARWAYDDGFKFVVASRFAKKQLRTMSLRPRNTPKYQGFRPKIAILDVMMFAVKAEVRDVRKTLEFIAQKTMYGGKNIAEGDTIFIFASENEGGLGLIARGVVSAAESIAKKTDVGRQTPRVSLTVEHIEAAKRPLGRRELKRFSDWKDGRPETEINFKFYRQATNKIVSVSDHTAAFLNNFF